MLWFSTIFYAKNNNNNNNRKKNRGLNTKIIQLRNWGMVWHPRIISIKSNSNDVWRIDGMNYEDRKSIKKIQTTNVWSIGRKMFYVRLKKKRISAKKFRNKLGWKWMRLKSIDRLVNQFFTSRFGSSCLFIAICSKYTYFHRCSCFSNLPESHLSTWSFPWLTLT